VNTLLWALQALLALAMAAPGTQKLTRTKDQLIASGSVDWAEDFPAAQIKAIGAAEVAAALGLILPPLLDIAPVLCPIAATAVVLIMLGAARTHHRRGERHMLPVNLLIGAIALFVAIQRFGPQSF
jgi:uncharacterized membrane protein YphA (DoxX/SURF4 family)